MSIDTTFNPVALFAFMLTCAGCVQALLAILALTMWLEFYSDGVTVYESVWNREICTANGDCLVKPGRELVGGQEAYFVSKVFATFTGGLSLCAVVAHIVYFFFRRPMIRTSAIFIEGAACVFGLLAVFIFIGFYASLSGDTELGEAFYILLLSSIVCGAAAGVTAWASVKRASSPLDV